MKSLEERKKARAVARAERLVKIQTPVATGYDKLKKVELQKLLQERGYEIEEKDTVADLIQTLKDDDAEKAKKGD